MTEARIKVGLVGCGQIADAHLQQIRRVPIAEPVAVCDLEPLLARQAAERFEVPAQFTCLNEMLEVAQPDVVHLTTPVQTHAPLTIQLLEAGVHPQQRDAYTYSKVLQEDVARQVAGARGLSLTVLRPGVIYGDERGVLTHRIGLHFGGWLLRMGGRQQIPLTYVDNCASAVVQAGLPV